MSALPKVNDRVVLAKRPTPGPITEDIFKHEQVDIPELKDGEVLVRVEYCGIEAAMRTWVNDTRNYIEPVKLGDRMRAYGIGHVISTKSNDLGEGDLVFGEMGWQEYWSGPSKAVQKREIPAGTKDVDILGLLGISGITAYFGLMDIGELKEGDNVVISGAAGGVGLVAVQMVLAKKDCKVTAIAGSPEKCKKLKEMGCHTVLNYKDESFKEDFKKIGYIDVYFDNVGGEILDLVLGQMATFARIVECGQISVYSSKERYGLKNSFNIVAQRAKMQGFIMTDYAKRYPEAVQYLGKMIKEGKLVYDYHVIEPSKGENGLSKCVGALRGLGEGKNTGKTVVRIAKQNGDQSKL